MCPRLEDQKEKQRAMICNIMSLQTLPGLFITSAIILLFWTQCSGSCPGPGSQWQRACNSETLFLCDKERVVSSSKWIKIFPFVPLWARSDSITDNTTEKINLDEELEKPHWSDCEMFVILRNIQFKNDSHSLWT